MFTPSKYQQDIFNWHTDHTAQGQPKALVINAVAGSGKTTTLVKAQQYNQRGRKALLAFNKSIADNLSSKPELQSTTCKTYHAFGLAGITQSFGKVKIEGRKLDYMLGDMLDRERHKHLFPVIKRLVGLCKANLLFPDQSVVQDLIAYHGFETNGDMPTILNYTERLFQQSIERTYQIDFDDMVCFPFYHNLTLPQYDYIAVDELQDTNAAQIDLVQRSIANGGIVVGVGDPAQSIYGFRGADVESIPKFAQHFQADLLPLSISYRAPYAIGQLVNATFPNLPFEISSDAISGEVRNLPEYKINYQAGDMVLCRCNAPLVKPCLSLLKRGIKAIIKGQDIGAGLVNIVKRMKADSISELYERLDQYLSTELSKLFASGKELQATLLTDKIETIYAIGDGCNTVLELTSKIETIFSDGDAAITFSSVHKAKGLEAENVYILEPHLMPLKAAKQPWEQQQEQNIIYVAYTRSLNTLTFVQK